MLKKIIQRYYVSIIIISTLITIAGFAMAIIAEVRNQETKKMESDGINSIDEFTVIMKYKSDIDTFAYTGIILLFIGFLISSITQTYVLVHTRKKIMS